MKIWLDSYDSIDIEACAMAPYADEADLEQINRMQQWGKGMIIEPVSNED